MMRDRTKLETFGVGVNAVRSQNLSGSCPNLSRNRYQAQPGFFTTAKRFADQHLIPVSLFLDRIVGRLRLAAVDEPKVALDVRDVLSGPLWQEAAGRTRLPTEA